MEPTTFGIPLKPVDQTDKEAEYYRKMVIDQGAHINILENNVKELQENLQKSYMRIDSLIEQVNNLKMNLNIQSHWESQDGSWQEEH